MQTENAVHVKIQRIISEMKRLNYKIFEDGDYNVNLIGLRNNVQTVTDEFTDEIVIFYKINNKLLHFTYPCTTIAGAHYFKNPMLPEFGTAILAPGQYRSSYALGYHYGLPALVQVGNVSVYRDNNRDLIQDLDPQTLTAGSWYGINIHYSWNKTKIGRWSAGCQVLPYEWNSKEYNHFLSHFQKASAIWGNRFTYTLLNNNF